MISFLISFKCERFFSNLSMLLMFCFGQHLASVQYLDIMLMIVFNHTEIYLKPNWACIRVSKEIIWLYQIIIQIWNCRDHKDCDSRGYTSSFYLYHVLWFRTAFYKGIYCLQPLWKPFHCVSEIKFPSVKEFLLYYELKRPLNVFQSVCGEIKQSKKKVLLSIQLNYQSIFSMYEWFSDQNH